MLKDIRKIPLVNLLGRNILKLLPSSFKGYKLKWRTSGRISLKVNQYNFKMLNKCDDGIIDQIYYKLDYPETNDLSVFIKFIEPGSTVFDIGSNTGIYSILSAVSQPYSKIFAFEPNPINSERLSQNLALNKLNNVELIENAIGEENKIINLNVPENDIISDTTSVIEEFSKSTYKGKLSWKKIEVEQFSIDEMYSRLNLTRLDLIKIDVEGYEIEVLKGAQKVLKSNRPKILLETFPDREKQSWFKNFVTKFDYKAYTISNTGLKIDESDFEVKEGYNYLLIPAEMDSH